jgi:hypothetical protein
MFAGVEGIDRIITVQVMSNFGIVNSFATVRNTITNTFSTIPVPPVFSTEMELYDKNIPGVPKQSSLWVKVPKGLLNLVAPEIPAVATSGMGGDVSDRVVFMFDTFRWMNDATLQLYGTGLPEPGSPYPFSVSGLVPNSFFDVFVDDMMVLNGFLDPLGSFSGQFIFPPNKSAVDVHYLAVQDNTGEFAYNISSPRTPIWVLPNTIINSGQSNCFDASQTITAGGGGRTFIVMPGGSANLVAGHNIYLLDGVQVLPGGYLHANITTNGSYCGSQTPPVAAPFAFGTVDVSIGLQESFIKIYPNPTTGTFTLELPKEFEHVTVQVEIYNPIGTLVLSERLTGNLVNVFSLAKQPSGIYFLRVIAGNRVETVKIIKQ